MMHRMHNRPEVVNRQMTIYGNMNKERGVSSGFAD
jgi:hypothetical protein